ncbi:unnamed protein product [Darwinula stevensoni]|uniref:Protein MIX23 n=1 Tax=Darwinula stevensoni TaxID=69355 RepID=A0A7R9AH31_9CRUS|nr:unnamed protein product [Darwinula stevensoni]CAG0904301.1 unnamed protein product [Darwinula stevensoni]
MAAPRTSLAVDSLDLGSFQTVSCHDFLEFQDVLKKMRVMDDKIVYALNTSIPTDSFKGQINPETTCKDLYEQLQKNYSAREAAIKRCLGVVLTDVSDIKRQREKDPDNINLLKELRKQQTKLRLMQSELNVEEVVKDRTLKVFYERCRLHYKPPDISHL